MHGPSEAHPGETGPEARPFVVDAEAAEEVRARRRYDYAARRVPLVRSFGFALMILVLAMHNACIPGTGTFRHTLLFTAVTVPYCALSWVSLRLFYGRTPFDLAEAWMGCDFLVRGLAIYCSGGPSSWLFLVMLTGIYDNVLVSTRATLGALAVSLVLYIGLLVFLHVNGSLVPWGQEGTKLLILTATGIYFMYNAQVAEALRAQRREAVHLARELILRTREQSEALREAAAQAEEHSRQKSAFLAGMSHELRTPLNAILLYSELLENEALAAVDTALAADVQKIRSAGRHLLGLVNDLLDLSKIEAGRMELFLEPTSLHVLGEEVAVAVEGLIARGGNRLVLELPDPGVQIQADALRLRQILLNLLGNAAKFTEGGAITLRVGLEAGGAAFDVIDTGIGMTPEELGRIFHDFAQANVETTRKYGGTGLGLSLSQKLCGLMGGTIEVFSEAGKGSRFRVWIPDPEQGTARSG